MGLSSSKLPNQEFMACYQQLQKDFKRQKPLFHLKDISFPLSTQGMKIIDSTSRRVKIAGVNWSGGHAERHCVGGLDYRDLQEMCNQIKDKFQFNCIRLTFSLQLFYRNNILEDEHVKANPSLFGKKALEVLDFTIETITKTGLMVILNNHTSKSMWCCTPWDGDGLWHTKQYPEEHFFFCLKSLAEHYKHNPRVIGIDLRNQVRANGLTLPTWGDGDSKTDWKIAAEKIGNQIQQIAPHWLIFIGGINSQTDFSDFWENPYRLKIPNKLVYTGHFYSFSWLRTIWKFLSYEEFMDKIMKKQLFVRGLQGGVPFLLGEFGTNQQDIYWNYLMKLMQEYDLDYTYWCLDGYKCKNQQDQTFGIYSHHHEEVRHPFILRSLKAIGNPQYYWSEEKVQKQRVISGRK